MRISVALYPFCAELLPAVKFFEKFQNNYKITKLIAPSGLGLTNQDASYARNHPDIGIRVTDNMDMEDSEWDILILARTIDTQMMTDKDAENIMERALQAGKKVIYTDNRSTEISREIIELCENHPNKTRIYANDISGHAIFKYSNNDIHINTPVILVGGLIEEADTFEVFLSIADRLRKEGLSITSLTNHPIGGLFGFHNINTILSQFKSEGQKIKDIIQCVKELELKERADVILMEAPDAIIRYSDFAPNGFGIHSYMLCQAIRPDYFFCCVPCDLASSDFIEALSNDFAIRLNSPINAVHVSNIIVDGIGIESSTTIPFAHANMDIVRRQIETESANTKIPMFDVVNEGIEKLFDILRNDIISQTNI